VGAADVVDVGPTAVLDATVVVVPCVEVVDDNVVEVALEQADNTIIRARAEATRNLIVLIICLPPLLRIQIDPDWSALRLMLVVIVSHTNLS
jgi:hypothetical protein